MLIYRNNARGFISDVRENSISDIMTAAFVARWGHSPGVQELHSWQNSLSRVRDVIELAGTPDVFVALEYEVPYNESRIDCLLFGRSASDQVVLIELKQWSNVEPTSEPGNFVETYVGGGERLVAHPSQQVAGYCGYLRAFVTEFEAPAERLELFGCAYCHNYEKKPNQGLFAEIYEPITREFPLYIKSDAQRLAETLKGLLAAGEGFEVFNRFMQSPIRPSLKLLDNVSKLVKGEGAFSLLNEQLVAKNLIWGKVRRGQRKKTKSVVIVHGGPGTGKSLIALNVMAEAAEKGQKVFYACKSKSFLAGLQKRVGRQAAVLFSNLYRFLPSKVKEDEVDLLLVDEAHRIENSSNYPRLPVADRTDMPQVDQLVRCSRTVVFFIDDRQNVRSQEIGSFELIRRSAREYGCEISEVTLLHQFRCMGSNDYLLWIESVLGYTPQQRKLRKDDLFDFQIFDSPSALYDVLAKAEAKRPNSARLVAGFCWPWSNTLAPDGSLRRDVKIGNFEMPWETHFNITRPPAGYVKWYEWAFRPEGFKQVGCIYTAQGFEFDYIGVIIGDNLVYDPVSDQLKGNIAATKDPKLRQHPENFETHVKNIYRTLLTRGMKGCFVFFTNKETENFFRRFIEIKKNIR
jgi:DUF2075 family protein